MSDVLIIKKRKDFVRVAKQGVKSVASTVILQAAQSLSISEKGCQVGYTTTKKIGKAHIRNRTRRRMRAAVRELFPSLAIEKTDYVLIGRYNTADCPFENLKKDLAYALRTVNKLLNKKKEDNEKISQPESDLSD